MEDQYQTAEELKEVVKEKYAKISHQSRETNASSCCGSGGCCDVNYSVFAEDYSQTRGYVKEADLALGCGLPTEFARIKKGDTVVDLGSGAGNDCFIARQETGESGRVIGIDMTEEMTQKAKQNAEKLGYENVEFITGDIEEIPLVENTADVVVSNCVLNLVPDKTKAFSETFRILKPGGHFSISDIVTIGDLPGSLKKDAEMYAGCVSGAIDKERYLQIIRETGFNHIVIQKAKEIHLPDEILARYLSETEIVDFRNSGTGIFSITVYAEKPGGNWD